MNSEVGQSEGSRLLICKLLSISDTREGQVFALDTGVPCGLLDPDNKVGFSFELTSSKYSVHLRPCLQQFTAFSVRNPEKNVIVYTGQWFTCGHFSNAAQSAYFTRIYRGPITRITSRRSDLS
ncbi:unnamed protein product [Toxocara canis]|uniref:Peptidase A1 domain-containing protein n=1 Tax=Toxocara canis TaxID=6265 RepID=A0A183U756_TOXCA|nr:unnamed protein product [Toxocara canis]